MLKSLLIRYETEGEKILESADIYVCSICGFVYIGDAAPDICPVCKVSDWKFDKMEGRA
ncbi:MAG: rubredoxin-like domain-containing protein [Lachnospiraceae bacterium]